MAENSSFAWDYWAGYLHHDHAEGADLAPVVRGSGPQEALTLLTGQIFAFSVRSEQFISHLFTLAHPIPQEKGLNRLISGGGQGRR